MKSKNNKGFTLAEMLIVVAIIGVLVAIVAVTISNSLEKAREATDLFNIRSAVSMLQEAVMEDTGLDPKTGGKYKSVYDNIKDQGMTQVLRSYKSAGYYEFRMYVKLTQTISNWQSNCVVAGVNLQDIGAKFDTKHNMIKVTIKSDKPDEIKFTQDNFDGTLK